MSDYVEITAAEAISVLPEGEYVHTFRNPGFGLMGADWTREEAEKHLNEAAEISLTGTMARGMEHGMMAAPFLPCKQSDLLFIATDEDALAALEALKAGDK